MKPSRQPQDILFLIPSLRGGGAERVVVTLLRHLDRRRFRVLLAVVDMSGAVYHGDVPSDVELIDLKSMRVRFALPKIFHLIWSRRPDIVFSTLGHLNLALAILRIFLPNDVRYVAREATVVSKLPAAYPVPQWWFWAYRRFYSQFDLVICQSTEMQEDLVGNFGLPRAKTVVIYNPVDIERIRVLCGEPVGGTPRVATGALKLVAAGSLTHVKGFDVLMEALAKCPEREIHLTLLGDGPLREDLERLVESKGLTAKVEFVGFKKNPYAYFSRADAFVLSSRFEGFPNVVLESLACGTPVVAVPSSGGVREILATVEGCVLADNCSVEALARALAAFDAGRRIPQEALEPYAVANVVDRYEEYLLRSAAS